MSTVRTSLFKFREIPIKPAAAMLCIAILFTLAEKALAVDAFYSPAADEVEGAPGSIIRQEVALGAPDGAKAYRVLYRSRGLNDEPIAVSGLVVVPDGSAPPEGRPIVAWAHPTSGVVPKCAPSLAWHKFDGIRGLDALLEQGYIVAATDYPGLGTEGPHPYLVGDSEARAVIDAVRAARAMPEAGGSNKYIAWGHSQGGQAVLFTGLISENYAPELKLLGIAAAAPATDLGTLLRDDFSTVGGKNLTAMTLWSWARVYDAPIRNVVAPAAITTVDALADECIETIFDFLERQHTGKSLATMFLTVDDVTLVEPWKSLMRQNTPGQLPSHIPVFLAQGTADDTVQPAVTERYMRALCKKGSRVRMATTPNVGHAFIARDASAAAVDWIAERFAGHPAPNDC